MTRRYALVFAALSTTAPAAAQPAAGVDRHGDPLPAGAVGRLGTVRLRHLHATHLHVPPDGRTIVTSGWGGAYRVFDTLSGSSRQSGTLSISDEKVRAAEVLSFGEAVTFTPDGAHAVDLLPTGDLVRDRATGRQVRRLEVEDRSRFQHLAHAFTPDGRCLVVSGKHQGEPLERYAGRRAIVYDLTTGTGRWLGRPNESHGSRVALTPDATRLVWYAADHDGVVCWDTAANRRAWAVGGRAERVLVRPPGTSALVVGRGAAFRLLAVADGKPVGGAKLPHVPGEVSAAAWSPDGRVLAVASGNEVLLWDADAGAEVRRLPTGADLLAFAADGRAVFTLRGVVQKWDAATGKPLLPPADEWGHAGEVSEVHWSPDGKTLLTASVQAYFNTREDGRPRDHVFRWDVATRRPLTRFAGPVPGVRVLGTTPDGGAAAVAADLAAYRWNPDGTLAGRAAMEQPAGHPWGRIDSVNGGRVLPGGDRALLRLVWVTAASTRDGSPSAWDLRSGKVLAGARPEERGVYDSGLPAAATATGYGGDRWDWLGRRTFPRLEAVTGYTVGPVMYVQEHPDLLVLGTQDEQVRTSGDRRGGVGVWEAATGRLVRHIPFRWVFQRAVSPDGRTIACFSFNQLCLFDTVTGKALQSWDSPTWYGRPAFSPDGRLLATGLQDGTVALWPVPEPTRPGGPAGPEELERVWADLAAADAGVGWRAVW